MITLGADGVLSAIFTFEMSAYIAFERSIACWGVRGCVVRVRVIRESKIVVYIKASLERIHIIYKF